MGLYEIPAALNARDRMRRANVLPITLGPHGSNFEDVVQALQPLIPLDQGILLYVKGVQTNVCVFTLCFTGDMPPQQENFGFKTQRAIKGCRFCFIGEEERGNLAYGVVKNGRFHHQTVEMRQEMNSLEGRTTYRLQYPMGYRPSRTSAR